MTKRLTLVGVAAVAVVWGPYVYAELAREPLPAAGPAAQPAPLEPTPVVYAAHPPEPVQLVAAPAAPLLAAPAVPLLAAPEQAVVEPAEQAPPAVDDPSQPTAASDETTIAAATDSRTPDLAAPAVATEQVARAAPAVPAPQVPAAVVQVPAAEPAREVAAVAEAEPTAPAAAARDDETARAAKEDDPADKQRAEAKPKSGEHEDAPTPESLAPAFRSTFAREARDAQWASTEEPRLARLLSGAGVPPAAIAEVRCQSTVCRIALNSVDVKAVQQSPLYQVLYQRVRDEFGPVLLDPTDQDGEQHAAFYVLRKGYELERPRDSY
jgi:hypothetical protein